MKRTNVNTEQIKKMIEAVKEVNNNWREFTIPNKVNNPPAIIPTGWAVPFNEERKDILDEIEERELIRFMQECRERTAAMKDDEKCAKCKLRFRCYTEIRVEKKRKTRTRKPKKTTTVKQMYYAQPQPLTTSKWSWTDGFNDEWRKIILDVGNSTESNSKEEG